MKALLIVLMVSTFSFTAFAGVKTFYKTGSETYNVHDSFELDAFSNLDNYVFCFTGAVYNVCGETKRGELNTESHGYYRVLACDTVDRNLMKVLVNVRTDYGDDEEKRYSIPRCTIEQAIQ